MPAGSMSSPSFVDTPTYDTGNFHKVYEDTTKTYQVIAQTSHKMAIFDL